MKKVKGKRKPIKKRRVHEGDQIREHMIMQFFLPDAHINLFQTWLADKGIMITQQDRYMIVSAPHITTAVDEVRSYLEGIECHYKVLGRAKQMLHLPVEEFPERTWGKPRVKCIAEASTKVPKTIIRRPLFGGTRTRVIEKEV